MLTDKSGNEIHLDTSGSNINITAPETINITAKNLNINITENINTSAGMNISERTGINKTESAGANHSITAGGMMLQNAVMDYTLMAANIMEVAQGERKSRAKKINENSSEHSTSSQGKTNVLAKENIHKNSGEKSNFQ